jgi:hypothetical protein
VNGMNSDDINMNMNMNDQKPRIMSEISEILVDQEKREQQLQFVQQYSMIKHEKDA